MRRLLEVDLAELPHRFITTEQLRRLGWTNHKIRYHVAVGDLTPVIRGVYSVDADFDPFLGRAIAMCLRQPECFLSGPASTHYWRMRRGAPEQHEFTVPESCRPRGVSFVQFRYSRHVDEQDIFLCLDGLRVSTPARAAFEAAGRLDAFGLRSLIQSGLHEKVLTLPALQDVQRRLAVPGARGARLFNLVVAKAGDEPPVHSEHELVLLEALRERGLEVVPQHPLRIASGFTLHLDVAVPCAKVDLEVDGPRHDDDVIAVHRDKSRDRQVEIQGWLPSRIPTADIERRLRQVVAQVMAIVHQRVQQLTPRA